MKPKLKPDVYWVSQGESLAFIHPGNPLTVRGRSALPLMDRLAPYLDGTIDLDELVGGLPEGKRDMVLTMITALSEAGLVKDAQDDEAHPLTDAETTRYAAEIEYIDHHISSAGRRFHTFRTTRITCVGAGMSLNALAHACLRAGVADLTLLLTEDCPTDTELLDRFVAQAHKDDPIQRVRRSGLNGSREALRIAVEGADLVLHVSDRPVPARARELDRLCREHGRPLIQGVVVDDEAWTGPVGGAAGAGWESAWLRARGNDFSVDPVPESQFLAGPTASIVGNRVGFLAFQYVTGVAGVRGSVPPTETVSVVDLETLDTTEYRFLPHPLASPAEPETEAEAAQRFDAMLAAAAPDPVEFSRAAAELFDPRLGPLRTLDESDLPQLPLHLAEVTVSDPFGWLESGDAAPPAAGLGDGSGSASGKGAAGAVGLGDSFGEARHNGALRAFELYATLAVDPRRLTRGDGPDRVFARDLGTGAMEAIEAELAYPVLAKAGASDTFTRPAGLAAALTGAEALRLGLLEHCARLAAEAAGDATEPFPRVALDALPLTGSAALYRDAARTVLPELSVYDLSGLLGVPVTAWCDGESTVCCTAGSDLAEAVTAGLVQSLLYYQARESDRPGLVPAPGPQLPQRLRGALGRIEPSVTGLGREALVASLTAKGHRVYAVPAGHDPVVTKVLPTVVQVVLR